MAQSVKCSALGFGRGDDLTVCGIQPPTKKEKEKEKDGSGYISLIPGIRMASCLEGLL